MSDQDAWHSQDAFWELVAPVAFNQERLASAPAEVEQLVKLLPIAKQDRILDLCCGIGRHSLAFARAGFAVVGVDRTPRFIEQARQAAESRDLTVEFLVGDMREYCVPTSFDIVINLFGSFGYFEDPEDDRKVVEHIYASLRPGGKFLIETMGKEILARTFQARDWTETGDLLLLSEKKVSQDWGRIQTRWIAIRGQQRSEYRVAVRSYSAVELSSLLSACGFPAVQVYGDLEGSDYDQAAKRLVVIGRKEAGSASHRARP
jgi:SAM-dependent methyltransferase